MYHSFSFLWTDSPLCSLRSSNHCAQISTHACYPVLVLFGTSQSLRLSIDTAMYLAEDMSHVAKKERLCLSPYLWSSMVDLVELRCVPILFPTTQIITCNILTPRRKESRTWCDTVGTMEGPVDMSNPAREKLGWITAIRKILASSIDLIFIY